MYSRFYGFTTEPFQNTPDLDFLFLSPNHKEALACLEYGIQQRKGFIAVTGEAGVGKTIILRSYLTKVDAQKQKTIYVLNPKLTFDSLLTTILKELSAEPVAGIAAQKLNQLHEVLIAEYRNDHTVVLIIDEAQHIPIETLESIRMLSNMETATEKLIQIVLVGQPELDALLNRSELRHVRERIALRARIAPLTKTESEEYIDHRLNLVSREPRSVFSKQALDRIVKSANGIPRRLNILCDAVLITGFGYRHAIISGGIAKEAIAVFNGSHRSQPARRLQPRYALGLVSLVVAVAFYLLYLSAIPSITVSGPAEATDQNKEPLRPVLGNIGTDPVFASDTRQADSLPPARLVSELDAKGRDLSPTERMELSETARLLAVLLDSGRVVVGRAQPAINNPRLEDKGFTASAFEAQLRREFQARTRHDLHHLAGAPMPESAKPLLLRLSFFMQKAVHDVQPDINKKGIGL